MSEGSQGLGKRREHTANHNCDYDFAERSQGPSKGWGRRSDVSTSFGRAEEVMQTRMREKDTQEPCIQQPSAG